MSRTNFQPIVVATLFSLLASLPAFSDSQVRIVRLSYVDGSVQISRDSEKGFDKALVNLPVTQGASLRSGDSSRAEVEFEDGTTLRLTPNSAVEFPQLSLRDSGGRVSIVQVNRGTVFVDFSGDKNGEFAVRFSREKIALTRSSHLRIAVNDSDATVAVLKGEIQIESPSGSVSVGKGRTASFDFSDNDRLSVSKGLNEDPYDAWDKQQGQYHVRYASNSYNSYSPYAYGTSDLNYYGNFFNAPGYGMMWQPFFVGAGWDPFMDGAWAFSPGWGYGWVSAYPWGWTPYHYGTWVFLPGYGWAWQPGGVWSNWYSQPRVLNPPRNFSPPQAPVRGGTTVVVNHGPDRTNHEAGKLVIRNNSAGLGIPRGEVKNLGRASQQVQMRGTVTERLHPAPVAQRPAPSLSETRGETRGNPRGETRGRIPSEGRSGSSSRASAPPRASTPAPSHTASPPPPSGGGRHR